MKKLLLGLTLLGSMTTFANVTQLNVVGFNVLENTADVRCIEKVNFDKNCGGYPDSGDHSYGTAVKRTLLMSSKTYEGKTENTEINLTTVQEQNPSNSYVLGRIVSMGLTLGFSEELYIKSLCKDSVKNLESVLSDLQLQIPNCN